MSGALTILVSCYGLILWLRRNHEMSRRLRAFACVLVLAVGLSLVASVASFLLREVIASHFSAVDVRAQIIRFVGNIKVTGCKVNFGWTKPWTLQPE